MGGGGGGCKASLALTPTVELRLLAELCKGTSALDKC